MAITRVFVRFPHAPRRHDHLKSGDLLKMAPVTAHQWQIPMNRHGGDPKIVLTDGPVGRETGLLKFGADFGIRRDHFPGIEQRDAQIEKAVHRILFMSGPDRFVPELTQHHPWDA